LELQNGKLVEPMKSQEAGAAILDIVLNKEKWHRFSNNGIRNILAYSWPSHCIKYLDELEKLVHIEDPQVRAISRRPPARHSFDAVGAAVYEHLDGIVSGDTRRVRSSISDCQNGTTLCIHRV
jgi:hypothetical protein